MPSIKDLFGIADDVDDPEAGEENFDLDEFFRHANERINGSKDPSLIDTANAALPTTDPIPEPLQPDLPHAPPEPLAAEQPGAGDPLADGDPVPGTEPAPVVSRETFDPLSTLPPERRAQLLALDQAMSDPTRQDAILRAMSGQVPAPVVEAPRLPEDIDPTSFEAQLWRDNQDLKSRINEITGAVQQTRLSQEEQNAARDALQAGRIIMERYPEKLSQQDIGQIAAATQDSGLLFLVNSPKYKDNRAEAIAEAMEHTLWTNPSFREKVVETPAPIVAGDTAVAMDRKRKLNALSSAASPVSSAAPAAPALETRADGRLTESSRSQLVKELAGGIARANFNNQS